MNKSVRNALYEYLDRHYYDKLEFLNYENPKKMMIFFSGKSGVGKSTLARHLSKELKAIHLENDKIRILIQEYFDDLITKDDRNQIMWDYSKAVNERLVLESPNSLWIRDAMVDRFYEEIWSYCDENEINRFTISFQLSEDLTSQQVLKRGDQRHTNVKILLGELGQRQLKWRDKFLLHNTPDYIFTDENHGQYKEALEVIKSSYV